MAMKRRVEIIRQTKRALVGEIEQRLDDFEYGLGAHALVRKC